VQNVSILVAIGVDSEGFRTILGACEGGLKTGGQRPLSCFALALLAQKTAQRSERRHERAGRLPEAKWQRCVVHWYRNVFGLVPRTRMKEVSAMLKAIHAQEDRNTALKKSADVVTKLCEMKLGKAAKMIEESVDETLSYMAFPQEHWTRLRTNNPLERIMREIRRRTRVVGNFPDGEAALMLVCARLRHISGTRWGSKKYLDMERLYNQEREKTAVA